MTISTSQRILITGGAGFIGTHLAERLCDTHSVILFDNFRRDSLSHTRLASHPNVTVQQGDILDPASLKTALKGVDTVLHLAAVAGVSSYYREPWKTLKVNLIGTANLLDGLGDTTVRKLVYFSTSEVLGPDSLHANEEAMHRLGPVSERRWVYATSKLAGEQLVLRYGEEYGLHCTVLRPFNIYGPRQTGEGAISNFCSAAVEGRPLKVYGDGTAIRAWCYVSDMVNAVMKVLSNTASSGQVFHVGNPDSIETTIGLARRIARYVPGAVIRHEPTEHADVRARAPDIKKAQSILGYEPQVDLDQGLRLTLDWFQKRGEASRLGMAKA
jgi:UDP-glucose 4-epimerase